MMRPVLLLFSAAALSVAHAETLHYVINWQSGLNLGEATLTSGHTAAAGGAKSAEENTSALEIDASVPGFAIRDHYKSSSSGDFCSLKLDKMVERGQRKSQEIVTFHQDKGTITRQTQGNGGGSSDVNVQMCAKDALTFLQYMRKELAQGRLAPQQAVVLGGLYNIRMETAGTQTVKMLDQQVQADRINFTVKGPASTLAFEVYFARDAARTPVLAKIPLALGTFSVELTR
jgi:hypothetical protein